MNLKKLVIVASIAVFMSCTKENPRIGVVDEKDLTQMQIDSVLNEYNFVYSDLTFIDSTNQVLLPISTQKSYRGRKFRSYDSDYEDYPRYWNILFFNSVNDQTSLLTESKFRIVDFACNLEKTGDILKESILYKIGDQDYNKDKKFTYEDPVHLFISKTDGSGLKRLSPINEDLESYTLVPFTDKIIFRTKRDTNDDLNFDNEDELIWYQTDVSKENSIKEIIKPSERKLIENLYFKQWLVKEK